MKTITERIAEVIYAIIALLMCGLIFFSTLPFRILGKGGTKPDNGS